MGKLLTSSGTKNLDIYADEGFWGKRDLDHLEESITRPAQWGAIRGGVYKALASTHKKLPAGAYSITIDNNDDAAVFLKKNIKTDDIIRFRDSPSWKIIEEINRFWGEGEKFRSLGFLHRRGYLLYGPQGTGKSSVVQQVISDVIQKDGVVLVCEKPKFFNVALNTFRLAEPTRNVVCVFEDIDAIIKRHGEEELLSILDGANMVDRVLNIATTNYPELLDKRIVSRPRRFDRVLKIEVPTQKVRHDFLKARLPKGENVKEWMKATEGLSFAGISEAIISVICLGNSLDETIKILTDLESGHPSSDEFGAKAGLGFSGRDNISPDDD